MMTPPPKRPNNHTYSHTCICNAHIGLPRGRLFVCIAEVTQHAPEPVSHNVQATNHLQSSSAAGQSESKSPTLFFSLDLPASSRPLPLVYFVFLPVHLLPPSCHAFFQSPLSIKRSVDSPDSPHSYHSLFFHCAIFQPLLISVSLTLSLQSLLFMSLHDSLWSMLSIHALSPTERSMLSFIFHYSWALNSPYKHWHILRQMQLCRLLFSSPLKAFLNSFNPWRNSFHLHTHFFMSLTYILHKSALNKDKEIVYAYR